MVDESEAAPMGEDWVDSEAMLKREQHRHREAAKLAALDHETARWYEALSAPDGFLARYRNITGRPST